VATPGPEDFGLRPVEPGRECVDRYDETDTEGEPERGENRAAAPTAKLREHVRKEEHREERTSTA